ncbi:protein N-terminal asparagine amidohydrolase isoform X3 [Aquarana catesbeiana]|uniref:protein N-terminal asparagine amidohydrolase isoform X3 n=1 Tax=Aquarana catesbeiana TaxID=8400 RepID=UPI003CC95ADD
MFPVKRGVPVCSQTSLGMPVLIGSQRLDVTQPIARIIQMHGQMKERAQELTSQQLQIFGPKGCLYIHQRELAATTPNDRSGAICLAHCDGTDTENEVASIMEAINSLQNSTEGRLELHIVGGFNDERQLSQKLSQQLLRAFDNQVQEIHLVTFCVTDLNNKKNDGIHLPIIYGIAVHVKTGEIFKAKFPDHQPDEDLRLAYILAGGNMVNIYDAKQEQLNIGPYSWTPFPNVDFWLEQEDKQILQCFSTSPEAEPPHFVGDIRSALLFLKEHPYPCISLFPDRKPRSYKKKNDGQWQKS